MKLNRIKPKQKGFIVVVVLCIIICMAVLLLGFNYQSRTNLRSVGDFQKSAQALNCAKAGLNIAIAAIKSKNETDENKTSPSLLSQENTIDIGEGKCSLIITEENSKLNVNLLKDKSGKPNRTRIDQLLRLIDLLNNDRSDYS
ncbi:MAG: hypothetical protein ACYS67_17630, partial [Planctomycetota bacterium]